MSDYYCNNSVLTTGTTANNWTESSVIYFNDQPIVAQAPKPETEVEWLKRRVDETCWREAA